MISVIVPIYNVEQYLPKCVDSIINQTYRNLEIILVDDGSLDDSGKICDVYAKKDKRVKVYHKMNGGLADARNYGIARANGEYIGFVDGDDWISPKMFEILINIIEEQHADIVKCGFYYEYPKKTLPEFGLDIEFEGSINLVRALLNGYLTNYIWDKLYRKTCFNNILFPTGHVSEDVAIMYKVFLNACSAVCISKPLYYYNRKRKDAITHHHSLSNMVDYWLAHKSRFDYLLKDERFNIDVDIRDKLYYYCAMSIGRTWRWYYACTALEKQLFLNFTNEMHVFSIQNFPAFGMNKWPVSLRLSIFLGTFNNNCSFGLLYYITRFYKWVNCNVLLR